MMPYSKHTNMELLAVAGRCIGNLVDALDNQLGYRVPRPITDALRDELRKRTDENPPSDFPSPAEWVKQNREHGE